MIRSLVDGVLEQLSPRFNKLYARAGRPSIAPEKLLRALLLQMLYSVRSERLLMEQLDYNLLFRWFVGLSMDEEVWDASTFSKNRERLLEGDIAEAFFQGVLGEARAGELLSDEHFTVDGTLLEAWASHKSSGRSILWPRIRRTTNRNRRRPGGTRTTPRSTTGERNAAIRHTVRRRIRRRCWPAKGEARKRS
jgi:transposase